MAEGEGDYLNPAYDDDTTYDDDYDQEINRTRPPDGDSTWAFGPGAKGPALVKRLISCLQKIEVQNKNV